jgi:tetratricopeptide (TPR) repeat protein
MPSTPLKSLWDIYALMVEKSPTNTILFTGITLILILLFLLLLVLAFSPGLRTFLQEVIKGLRYSEGKLAFDGTPKPGETAVQTDEKGNVKPPTNPSEPEDGAQQSSSEDNQFFWLFKMEHAWSETDGPLTKVLEYYDNIQKTTGSLPAPFIEAEYLLARFKCGDASALETLRTKAGASSDAYAANGVLGRYYESIGEVEEALKCLENRFQHASDSDHKLYSARDLATFLAKIGKSEDGLTLLRNNLSYFQSSHDQAILWETIGTIYETKKLIWQKHLCFEKALKLDPNNTSLRFALAYSYGESGFGNGMAA